MLGFDAQILSHHGRGFGVLCCGVGHGRLQIFGWGIVANWLGFGVVMRDNPFQAIIKFEQQMIIEVLVDMRYEIKPKV